MPLTRIVEFVLFMTPLVMLPGPDFALITSIAMRRGRSAGILASLGIATGTCLWGAVSVLGLAAVLASSELAFTAVKCVGAAYLIYLGIKAFAAAYRHHEIAGVEAIAMQPDRRLRKSYVNGVLTNAMNPKAAVIFLTIIPQFLNDDDSSGNIILLAGIMAGLALTWFCIYSTLIGTLRPLLVSRRSERVIETATGFTLTGLGVRLAFERQ